MAQHTASHMKKKVVIFLFCCYVIFVIYNTFIPFVFDHGWHHLSAQIREIEWYFPVFDKENFSLTDYAGNIILFMPLGFLLYLLLYHRSSTYALLGSITAGVSLSVCIEFFQLFTSLRHTAVYDVINNGFGTLVGALGALVYTQCIAAMLGDKFSQLLRRAPFLLLVMTIGVWEFFAAMMPFTVSITISHLKESIKSTNIVPFSSQSIGEVFFHVPSMHDSQSFNYLDFVADILFWIPIGYILMLSYRLYLRQQQHGKMFMIVASLLYFPIVEIGQLCIMSRVADINDIISGYGGVLVGGMLYYLLRPIRRRTYRVDRDLLKIPLLLYGVCLVFAGLQPFDWSLATDTVGRNLQTERLVPFYAYYRNTSLGNTYDLIGALMSFVPLSVYWTWCGRARGRSWASIYVVTILAGLAWGVVSEGMQLLSPSRVADITDVLAYGSGGAVGTFAVYYHVRQSQLTSCDVYRRETILA